MSTNRRLSIAMLHPQMGIGGAERLTLDAAIGLERLGHHPTIFTRELPRDRSFDELRNGSIDVRVRPTAIPLSIGGRLKAPLTAARMATLARSLRSDRAHFDVAWVDLVAHAVPALRASLSKPVLFYCHYPDLLLTPPRRGLYSLYRRPIDALEQRGLRAAARVVVNSDFTASRFVDVFPNAPRPEVLYPGIELGPEPERDRASESEELVLLSVNRFTRAKNLPLAVESLAALRTAVPAALFARLRLVFAGGFDASTDECAQALRAIREGAAKLGLEQQVATILNPSEQERLRLLKECRCVLYTPEDEHFGLGPLEAMAAGKPVVAVSSGGPCETILDGQTGCLRPALPEAFADAIAPWLHNPDAARQMGRAGRKHVADRFSRERFSRDLEALLLSMVD